MPTSVKSTGSQPYRDGHNDYLLNGQQVRLRDLNELLAASGLADRTYTILGQGLVDASLALKAEDRRRLFEEAAGVSRYKAKKVEAERKLERVAQNLLRLTDIVQEVEGQLTALRSQAMASVPPLCSTRPITRSRWVGQRRSSIR